MSSDATGVVDLAADADVAFRIATKIYAGLAASQVMENCGDRYLSKSLLILLAKNLTKYFGIKFNIPVGNSHVKTLYDALSNIYDNLDPAFYRMVAKWLANLLYSHNMVQDVATVLRTAFECVFIAMAASFNQDLDIQAYVGIAVRASDDAAGSVGGQVGVTAGVD